MSKIIMSKINDLIKELCPNGIEFYKLFEIGEIFTGLSGKSKNDFENGNCRYITYTNIYNNSSVKLNLDDYVKVDDNEKQNDIKYKDILIAGSSENLEDSGMISVVTEEPQENIYLNSFCFGLRLNDNFYNKYNADFLKHLFRNDNFRKEIISCSFGVTRYNLSKSKFLKIKIPCPPIEVQEEIVKILDRFVKLETELEAELEERNRQYEFWRGYLLDNKKDTYVKLGDLCRVITKGTTPKKYTDVGINFIKTEAFTGNYVDKNKLSFVDNDTHSIFLKRSILEENDILFTIAGATIGKMTIVTKELLPANTNQALAIIRLKDGVNLNYIKNILKSNYMKEYIKLCVKGSAQPNLNLQQLNNFKFPYPSLEEQENIVNVLNNFDRLINDINEGLPAEIELRKQQYKYYRNKLLSFKEI